MQLSELVGLAADHKELPPTPETVACWYQPAISDFKEFLGHEPTIDDLCRERINAWLDSRIKGGKLSQSTIKTRRGAMVALWNSAFEMELLNSEPKRIRRLRVRRRNPTAWEFGEIQNLVDYALNGWAKRNLKGTQLDRGLYFASLIGAGYDTALRLGDLLSLEREWIRTDKDGAGLLSIDQAKTGQFITCRIQPATMKIIDRSMQQSRRRLIWPLWGRREAFYRMFRALVREARVRKGTFRWLRRASATHVEISQPGRGADHAGHADAATTRRHYLDREQLSHETRNPRALQF